MKDAQLETSGNAEMCGCCFCVLYSNQEINPKLLETFLVRNWKEIVEVSCRI